MVGRGTATASNQVYTCAGETPGIIGEVIGCGNIKEAIADTAWETRVWLGGEEIGRRSGRVLAGRDHLLQRIQGGSRPDATISPHHIDIQICQDSSHACC